MTGRRIAVNHRQDRRGQWERQHRRGKGAREEGFLLAILLQSAICVAMLAFAFVAGQTYGMTEVKSCFASVLSEEVAAVEVFSAVQNLQEGETTGKLIDWLKQVVQRALGLGDASSLGQGGELALTEENLAAQVMLRLPTLTAPMRAPLKGALTSPFGVRTHPISGEADFHTGLDLAAPQGTFIGAAYPGRVVEVGESRVYGNYIVLSHGGFATRYCHCAQILAEEGMQLREGETVATVGSTGMSTGPHLHFELLVQGKSFDPTAATVGVTWRELP